MQADQSNGNASRVTHKHCPVEGRSVLTEHQPGRASLSQTPTAHVPLKNTLHPERQETRAGQQKETQDERRKRQGKCSSRSDT